MLLGGGILAAALLVYALAGPGIAAPLPANSIEIYHATQNRPGFVHLRLPANRAYRHCALIYPPLPAIDPQTEATGYERQRLIIEGPGQLSVPYVASAAVQLVSNVTLSITGKLPADRELKVYFPDPVPADRDGTSMIAPRYSIAPGSQLFEPQ